MRSIKAVFLVVTTNDNIPDCRLSQDRAASVIQALQKIKADSPPEVKLPKLVLFSFASIDEHLSRNLPGWFPTHHARRRFARLRGLAPDGGVSALARRLGFNHPHQAGGSVARHRARGHRMTLDEEESFASYLDPSAGVIEAADEEGGQYEGRNVSVLNLTRGVCAKFPRSDALVSSDGLGEGTSFRGYIRICLRRDRSRG